MTTSAPPAGDYDPYAEQYAAAVARRESGGMAGDPFGLLAPLLELVGDVSGLRVLDAGCGTGYLARVLAARAAHVTGIDISPRLIDVARKDDSDGAIEYRVADLSRPLPPEVERFDAIAGYLVLNDVRDYRGFAATLESVLAPGGRITLALNNPYGAVIHNHVADYFDSGAVSPYRGLWADGIKTFHHHRTLENYLDAFLDCGLRLTKLADATGLSGVHPAESGLPDGARFPRFMLLAFAKPFPG